MSGPALEQRRRNAERQRIQRGAGVRHVARVERRNVERKCGRRLADQYRNRIDEAVPRRLEVDQLRLRRLQLLLRLRDIGLRRDPAREAVLRQGKRLLIRLRGLGKQALFFHRAAQLEVIGREFGLHREDRALQVGGTRLHFGGATFDRARYAAPQVRLPGNLRFDQVVGHRHARARLVQNIRRRPRLVERGIRRHGRKIRRSRLRDGRARAAKTRRCGGHGLVRGGDLLFERVQLRIAVDLPPRRARLRIGGLRGLPVLRRCRLRARIDRLVRRWHVDVGTHIVRADRAAGKRARPRGAAHPCAHRTHDALPSCLAGLPMRTAAPSMIESGGFRITRSLPARPDTIDTRVP